MEGMQGYYEDILVTAVSMIIFRTLSSCVLRLLRGKKKTSSDQNDKTAQNTQTTVHALPDPVPDSTTNCQIMASNQLLTSDQRHTSYQVTRLEGTVELHDDVIHNILHADVIQDRQDRALGFKRQGGILDRYQPAYAKKMRLNPGPPEFVDLTSGVPKSYGQYGFSKSQFADLDPLSESTVEVDSDSDYYPDMEDIFASQNDIDMTSMANSERGSRCSSENSEISYTSEIKKEYKSLVLKSYRPEEAHDEKWVEDFETFKKSNSPVNEYTQTWLSHLLLDQHELQQNLDEETRQGMDESLLNKFTPLGESLKHFRSGNSEEEKRLEQTFEADTSLHLKALSDAKEIPDMPLKPEIPAPEKDVQKSTIRTPEEVQVTSEKTEDKSADTQNSELEVPIPGKAPQESVESPEEVQVISEKPGDKSADTRNSAVEISVPEKAPQDSVDSPEEVQIIADRTEDKSAETQNSGLEIFDETLRNLVEGDASDSDKGETSDSESETNSLELKYDADKDDDYESPLEDSHEDSSSSESEACEIDFDEEAKFEYQGKDPSCMLLGRFEDLTQELEDAYNLFKENEQEKGKSDEKKKTWDAAIPPLIGKYSVVPSESYRMILKTKAYHFAGIED